MISTRTTGEHEKHKRACYLVRARVGHTCRRREWNSAGTVMDGSSEVTRAPSDSMRVTAGCGLGFGLGVLLSEVRVRVRVSGGSGQG